MSRSRKKQPFTGITTAESEKKDKQIWNRKFRRKRKQVDVDGLDDRIVIKKDGDRSFSKDGKQRLKPGSDNERYLRK
ncbi:MAG: hypothetical protein HUU10_04285 [Bacteroidetes bacterium]|nr:hypothetical protein [Bacteroidota bacterium]